MNGSSEPHATQPSPDTGAESTSRTAPLIALGISLLMIFIAVVVNVAYLGYIGYLTLIISAIILVVAREEGARLYFALDILAFALTFVMLYYGGVRSAGEAWAGGVMVSIFFVFIFLVVLGYGLLVGNDGSSHSRIGTHNDGEWHEGTGSSSDSNPIWQSGESLGRGSYTQEAGNMRRYGRP